MATQSDSVRFRVNVSTPGSPHPRADFFNATDSTVWVLPADPSSPNYPSSTASVQLKLSNTEKSTAKDFIIENACQDTATSSFVASVVLTIPGEQLSRR